MGTKVPVTTSVTLTVAEGEMGGQHTAAVTDISYSVEQYASSPRMHQPATDFSPRRFSIFDSVESLVSCDKIFVPMGKGIPVE